MQLRLIGTRQEVTAALDALRAAGWTVTEGREYPARANPEHIRVYATAVPPGALSAVGAGS
jgi:hypothetical protein